MYLGILKVIGMVSSSADNSLRVANRRRHNNNRRTTKLGERGCVRFGSLSS